MSVCGPPQPRPHCRSTAPPGAERSLAQALLRLPAAGKSSAVAARAARQYSGTAGGVALCQVVVTLTYATGRGHALIGRALYLPEACAADEQHRELTGVPEEVMFATQPQLADGLLDRVAPPQHRARQARQRWNAYAETSP